MKERIRKYILPNLPYLLLFWLFDLLGETYRISEGTDFDKLANAVINLGFVLSSPTPSFASDDLLAGLFGVAAVRGILYVRSKNAKKYRKMWSTVLPAGERQRTSNLIWIRHSERISS